MCKNGGKALAQFLYRKYGPKKNVFCRLSRFQTLPVACVASIRGFSFVSPARFAVRHLVDPASSHMLVSKIKPCMSQYKLL
jgi:hypothetical protein